MIRLAKTLVFFAILVVGGAGAATTARAQSATSCPGGSDPNASDCLQISGADFSLIAITEQDELDNPGKMWMIGGLVDTNPLFLGKWIGVTEPGTDALSDIVGIPTSGTLAFISDLADFSGLTIFRSVAETSGPIGVSDLLGPASRLVDTASFQSDFEASTVPEPSTWAMMLLGFAGLGYAGFRRRAAICRKSVGLVNV
jgi:PEP-CTERM motif